MPLPLMTAMQLFINFRADRARQMTQALNWAIFPALPAKPTPKLGYFCSMSEGYGETRGNPLAQRFANTLGIIGKLVLKQLRIAETENTLCMACLQRWRRTTVPRRRPDSGAITKGCHLRSATGNERIRKSPTNWLPPLRAKQYAAIMYQLCQWRHGYTPAIFDAAKRPSKHWINALARVAARPRQMVRKY